LAGRQRQALDDRLEEDSFLPPEQERAMIELDESVEALDSAIEYKNDILLRVRERETHHLAKFLTVLRIRVPVLL
jgi:hypothetical protein